MNPADDNQTNNTSTSTGNLDDQIRHGDLPYGNPQTDIVPPSIPMTEPVVTPPTTPISSTDLPSLPSLPPLSRNPEPVTENVMGATDVVPMTPPANTEDSGLPAPMMDDDAPPAPPADLPPFSGQTLTPPSEPGVPQVEQTVKTEPDATTITTQITPPAGDEVKPKKKGNGGKIIAALAALVLLIGGGIFATNTDYFLELFRGDTRQRAAVPVCTSSELASCVNRGFTSCTKIEGVAECFGGTGGGGGGGGDTTCGAWNVTCNDGATFSETSCNTQTLFNNTWGAGEGQNHWKTEACAAHGGVSSGTPTTAPVPGGDVGLCRPGQTPQAGENSCVISSVTNGSMSFRCNMRTVAGTFSVEHVWEKCSGAGTAPCNRNSPGYIGSGTLGGPGPWTLVCGQEISGTGTFEPITCGRVQVDVKMSDGTSSVAGDVFGTGTDCGGTVTTPTPTTPTQIAAPVCAAITAYTKNDAGNYVVTPANQLASKLKIGDTVRFGVKGANGTFSRARFAINNGAPTESTTKVADDYVYDYTITTSGTINVTAEVFVQ